MAAEGQIGVPASRAAVDAGEDRIEADVVVLGVGSAGEVVAQTCARGGLRVVAVESGLVGGECPYRACIPSKSLLGSAARGLGWADAVRRRDEHARHRQDRQAAEELLRAGAVLLRGTGRLSGPGRLTVIPHGEGQDPVAVGFGQLVVTTGSFPVVPDLPGLSPARTWTSDQALSATELPPRLMILGGGPVGCELAQAYTRFGSEVTVVESGIRLLPSEPAFVGGLIRQVLAEEGVRIRLGVQARRVEGARTGAGGVASTGVLVELSSGSVVSTDRILVAVGRRPNVCGIGLERLGIQGLEGDDAERGLPVDAHGRVARGVWAAGDVTGAAPFTHTATYVARVVADNLLGRDRRLNLSAVPRAVYTDPAVLSVGATPEQAAGDGNPLLQKGFDVSWTARGYLDGIRYGRVEVYADPQTGRVVGAAGVAPGADDLMGQAVLAVRAGLDVRVWADQIQPFPALSEVFGPPLRELVEELDPVPAGPGHPRTG
jgi:pyruvate/2-oxoglutarate dehydrogenase complex dihydrolipoamide dehydrogenase (E3) component